MVPQFCLGVERIKQRRYHGRACIEFLSVFAFRCRDSELLQEDGLRAGGAVHGETPGLKTGPWFLSASQQDTKMYVCENEREMREREMRER